jgi:hypothetical protein
MRLQRFVFVLTSLVCFISLGCRGCDRSASERPPASWIAKEAEAVVEAPDLGYLAKRRDVIRSVLTGVATEQQLEGLEGELRRVLGFDPLSEEGLKAAGLPAKGPLAVQVADGGRAALWVLPVSNAEHFGATVTRLAKGRAAVHKTDVKEVKGRKLTVLYTQWGPDEFPVVCWTVHKGMGFVGVGRTGPELVSAGLDRTREQSVLTHPEYQALAKDLGTAGAVRVIVPHTEELAPGLFRRLRLQGDPAAIAEASKQAKSVGWSLGLAKNKLTVDGKIRFSAQGLERIRAVWKTGGGPPKGVLTLRSDDAVIFALAAGDAAALVQTLSTGGMHGEIETLVGELNKQLGVDVMKQVLPLLSGHAAISLGVADLTGIPDLRVLVRNPARGLWTNLSLGVNDVAGLEKLKTVGAKLDPVLTQRGLRRGTRKVQGRPVASVFMDKSEQLVIETFVGDKAWLFANHREQTDRLAKGGGAAADPLGGAAGLFVELRFQPLVSALRQVDVASLAGSGASALLVRAFVAKAMLVLGRLERAQVEVKGVADGVTLRAELGLLESQK